MIICGEVLELSQSMQLSQLGQDVKDKVLSSVQFSSVAQLCPTLCDSMNRSTPGLPVHHQLPEFTQTHVHRVSDAIGPSHPLSSPSPPAPNPSQHQSLFQTPNFRKFKKIQGIFFIYSHSNYEFSENRLLDCHYHGMETLAQRQMI